MGKSHDDYVSRVIELLKDGAARIPLLTIPDYLASAIRDRYSVDRPLGKIYDKAADGTFTYDLPTDWESGFSSIRSIEYPKGLQVPSYLTPEDWRIYLESTGDKLRFIGLTPSVGNTIRVIYTLRHSLIKGAVGPPVITAVNTIPDSDFDAVCNWTISLCCRAIANYYSQTVDTALSADVVSYRTKREEYESQAKVFEKLYQDHIDSTRKESAKIGEWDLLDIQGMDFIFHDREYR